ncbi:MAG: hypothetical protein AB7P02_06530 [Alphaproteobacteria bacterium]
MATLSDLYVSGAIDGGEETGNLVPRYGNSGQVLQTGDGGFPVGDVLSLGRRAFQYLAPETYADATSFIPSWSEIGGALGFDGGATAAAAPLAAEGGGVAAGSGLFAPELAGTAFMDSAAFGGGALAEGAGLGLGAGIGGAMAAFGPAAAFYALFQLLASIPPTDGPVSFGQGISDLDEGFSPIGGPRVAQAAGLHDLWVGDRDWYDGGDPSKVDPLVTDVGSMSRKSDIPYFSIGGAPYRNEGLAVSSGRQIARGQMGLPVDYEPLPQGRDYATGSQQIARVTQDQSLPAWDAPHAVPEQWNLWQDRANLMVGGGGNTEASVWAPETIDAYRGTIGSDRGREFFDAGLRTYDMYGMTGPGSPDWGAVATGDELGELPGNLTKPAERDVLRDYQWGAIG